MNFYAVLGFFPVMLNELYTPDPILVGVRALSYPFAILGGACVVSALLSYTRGHVRVMFTLVALMMSMSPRFAYLYSDRLDMQSSLTY